jgi:hypothetical protein
MPQTIEESKIRQAFQATAEACGSDILQCCVDCEEEPVITRDCLYDYLEIHGGEHGKEVQAWLFKYPGNDKALNRELNRIGVPKTWA